LIGFRQGGGPGGQASFAGLPLFFQTFRVRFHHTQEPVGILQEPVPNQGGEEFRIFLPAAADHGDEGGEIQAVQGVTAVQPGVEHPGHEDDAVGVVLAVDFPALDLDLVEGPFNELPVHPLPDDPVQGVQDQGRDGPGPVGVGAPEPHGEYRLAVVPFETRDRREVLAQAGID